MRKRIIETPSVSTPVAPYNHAVYFNGMIHISGQIALNPETGQLVQDSIEAETHQVMKNLMAILSDARTSAENLLKCTIFLADMKDYAAVNAVYAQYIEADKAPARECVAVLGLPRGARVEISALCALTHF